MTLNWRYIYLLSLLQELISFEEEHSKKNIVDELWTIYICEFALIFFVKSGHSFSLVCS